MRRSTIVVLEGWEPSNDMAMDAVQEALRSAFPRAYGSGEPTKTINVFEEYRPEPKVGEGGMIPAVYRKPVLGYGWKVTFRWADQS